MQSFPHGDKLIGRIKRYPSEKELIEILKAYETFKMKSIRLDTTDSNYIMQIIEYVNEYLYFFSQERFDTIRKNFQSKLYPSILEEFMHYLFKPVLREPLVCGTGRIPIASYFKPYNKVISSDSYEESLYQETTDADFVIGIPKESKIEKTTNLCPIVIIENKRYADKTMRGTIENVSKKVKLFSQDCLYLVVLDLLSGFFGKDYSTRSSSIDQIYGLREGNNKGDNSLRPEVVLKLYLDVENHLRNVRKFISVKDRCNRGYMMGN